MHSQIAEGQEAVFRYGRRLKTWADNSSFWHPRLWCFLVGPVILTTVLLALTVNLFWKHSFDEGLARQEEADTTIFENFNNSTTDAWQKFSYVFLSFHKSLHRSDMRCDQIQEKPSKSVALQKRMPESAL